MSDQPLLIRAPQQSNAPLKPIKPLADPELLARVCDGLKALPCQPTAQSQVGGGSR
jgi:hypothetical protein